MVKDGNGTSIKTGKETLETFGDGELMEVFREGLPELLALYIFPCTLFYIPFSWLFLSHRFCDKEWVNWFLSSGSNCSKRRRGGGYQDGWLKVSRPQTQIAGNYISGGGWSGIIKPCSCGTCWYIQVDSVRIEMNYPTPRWFLGTDYLLV